MSMAHQAAAAGGDTRLTKLFVGGLAWETSKEGVRGHFERFGEILEAVVIADKGTGRSKGYGFVTFREAEAAMRACLDPYPVIDGRRANCNLACLGVQRSKAPQTLPYLQPYAAVGHVHGGGNINTRAVKAAIAAAAGGGASFVDHGIQQGVPAAAYNMYGYSPYFSDYSYQPLVRTLSMKNQLVCLLVVNYCTTCLIMYMHAPSRPNFARPIIRRTVG
ncbi:unnamed protein product [Triticum turgidum subsp. durum]|uniref:RRM domain-containing protein n=1 Tax=Triticum turgidum subsp. durum TaxID=4567 RepID=A0A9R1QYL8_TRITD|nr:unnamed protein product [Triticum turgidum subsp. durum]